MTIASINDVHCLSDSFNELKSAKLRDKCPVQERPSPGGRILKGRLRVQGREVSRAHHLRQLLEGIAQAISRVLMPEDILSEGAAVLSTLGHVHLPAAVCIETLLRHQTILKILQNTLKGMRLA